MTQPIHLKNAVGPLFVILLERLSDENLQNETIEASYENVRNRLAGLYAGPIEIKCYRERGSGWNPNRPSIVDAEAEIRAGKHDLVLMEDIGRAYRSRQDQYRFAHRCVDHETRLICFGDGIDTAEENWEALLSLGMTHHGAFSS